MLDTHPQTSHSKKVAEPMSGTLENFNCAIEELKGTLRKDSVSTDLEDMFIHGLSVNDHYSGMIIV